MRRRIADDHHTQEGPRSQAVGTVWGSGSEGQSVQANLFSLSLSDSTRPGRTPGYRLSSEISVFAAI